MAISSRADPLLRRAGGEVEELGSGGLPLGMREPLAPEVGEVTLAPRVLAGLPSASELSTTPSWMNAYE